ncbi:MULTISPECIES: sigma-54-dependent Fis family transcriptional regulator [Geobacillus]|jgi:PAS domain S-box-containing protein|uniref:Sensory box sigma-54 dependent DNA-binding response regulator n=4 Tax=Geobacillus thermodenitrificans TaxID=33940 RepID=A4IQQ7_GEOTN|nr:MULTISPECIES: sigma-54-dependent Fis family transcriptional regulator [Geobacillus]ABO67661.1 Sensory box sigma-54 dependent DNA-binding response regulator [Geobacillus thermodenitrificans NG80-2]ARP43400.1 Arginine utilization regulatory protein RocR [Geobacillus thermodenitrificans]ATO38513.1 sigma-54-dependent Fis family transcriptional regulator [Geobacillus thermodenitrificans]KQB92541.1 putative sigma L-dependent transcriptional regulator YqiR [Geobacillus sp. PA-3]MEC5187459.1 PAS do
MKKVIIIGADARGTSLLKLLHEASGFAVMAVIDVDDNAPGLQLARKWGIVAANDWRPWMDKPLDLIIETTGRADVLEEIRQLAPKGANIVPSAVARMMAELVEEKEALIAELKSEATRRALIFHSSHDGMIVVDEYAYITDMNESAAELLEVDKDKVIGEHILSVLPSSGLPRVLKTRQTEFHQEVELANGKKLITTRIPIIDESGKLFGALAVFKDITELVALAEEITDLKEMRMMLEAIIHSSEEAISVVDENGNGILINPAYTRLTGLTKEEVIGKPATADIAEGESMHMQVLKTRRPVRGVRMKVGPKNRDVVVNVAPIIVDGVLKGSVGVIHDVSEIQRLTAELNRARQIIRTLEAKYSFADIIGEADEMKVAIEQAKLAAKTPVTILLRGESGTGKELFAHAIHNASDRKYNKFIRVNCAAIPETLLESELFGYEEGAFSGARRGGKRGLFEEANNGSIFLDEIGELSASTQAKLLRVLQEREIVRVGGTKPIPINVRVIAATNVNLEKAIADGTFREDLYYRLNRMPIYIPPLRARKEDIPALCRHLIQKLNQDYGRNVEGVTNEAMARLLAYDWPGNVRELENVLGRAMIFMKFHEVMIDVEHLPPLATPSPTTVSRVEAEEPLRPLDEMVGEYEARLLERALRRYHGNKTATARALGISVRNLYYKLEKYGLDKKSMQ